MDHDSQRHLEHLLQIHQRNLARLETQAAQYGTLHVPTPLSNELDAERDAIAHLEALRTTVMPSASGRLNDSCHVVTSLSPPSAAVTLNDRNTQPPLDDVLVQAASLDIAGMSLLGIATHHYELLCQKVQHGCAVRLLLLNPRNHALMQLTSAFLSRYTPEIQTHEIIPSLQILTSNPTFTRAAQIRLCDYPLAHGLLIVNGNTAGGALRVELYVHSKRPDRTPGFWLQKDNAWYDGFWTEFHDLWESATPYAP